MRLISQNGWGYVDVEYENGTISMHDESEGTRIIYSWDNNSEESAIMEISVKVSLNLYLTSVSSLDIIATSGIQLKKAPIP